MSHVRITLLLLFFLLMVAVAALWQGTAVQFHLKRRKSFPRKFHKVWCWLFGIRVIVVGEPVRGKGVLLVANHQSYLDVPIVGSTTRQSFIARHDVARWPVVGTMVRLQESVLIERKKRGKAGEQMSAVRQRMADGEAVVIFAEGTTTDGRMLPFKSALLAAAVGDEGGVGPVQTFPVQPVSVTYVGLHGLPMGREDRRVYSWVGDEGLLPHLWAMLRAGPMDVVVQYHPPLTDLSCGRKAVAAAAEHVVRAGREEAYMHWRNAA